MRRSIFGRKKKSLIPKARKRRGNVLKSTAQELERGPKKQGTGRGAGRKSKRKKTGCFKTAFIFLLLIFILPSIFGKKGKEKNEVSLVSSETSSEESLFEESLSSESSLSSSIDSLFSSSSSNLDEDHPSSEKKESADKNAREHAKESQPKIEQSIENKQSSSKSNVNRTENQQEYDSTAELSSPVETKSYEEYEPATSSYNQQENENDTVLDQTAYVDVQPHDMGSGPIKGNVNSKGEKIYHMRGQQDYDKIIMRAEEGDRYFQTEEEARAAGFRPAKR